MPIKFWYVSLKRCIISLLQKKKKRHREHFSQKFSKAFSSYRNRWCQLMIYLHFYYGQGHVG